MFKRGIRGGITQSVKRWAKANNRYMGSEFDPDEKTNYLQYLDANNLYGWAMSQPLPIGGFCWVDIKPDKISKLAKHKSKGYLLEVDVRYPKELHDSHNDLPFMCERMKINGLSEQLKRALNKHNIKATFYTQTTLRSLLPKPKDPIPKEDRNNAVYQLNCKDCEAVYVGETKRTLNIRAEEHITAIKSASKKSHTAEHCWKYNHDFDWKHKKVLGFEKNWKTRTIKESIYSEENEHHINGISFKLPNIWKPIL